MDDSQPLLDRVISHYRIVEKLGGGGKTEVHLLPDIGHCAVLGGVSKLPGVIDLVTQWLPKQIGLDARPQSTNR